VSVDSVAEAGRRADLLAQVASGRTLAEVGLSAATYSRWRRAYEAQGLKGLEPKFGKCGRKPMARLDDWERTMAKQFYVKTESVVTSLRMLAALPECSADTAAAILKKRHSKHSIPRNLRHSVAGISPAAMAYHKSPKDVRTNFFVNPRTLTYLDPLGQERPLLVGDISERDDMSNNFLCWVDWSWGGDPCSDRYGVRVARGQALTQIDAASCYFPSFCFIVRLRDSYRADDIWAWVGHTYRDMYVPAIGERWERGIWKSNKLRGVPIEAGHTPNEERIGGIQALGRRVIESQSPTTKIIEGRFNFLQTISAVIPGQIGRRRGEMERETKLWMECRDGRRDPRKHFLSMPEICNQMEAKMHFANHEPMEGLQHHGIPAEIYKRGLEERADVLKPLSPELGYLFCRDLRWSHASKGHALVRYTNPDGRRAGWYFYHPELFRYEGEKLAVYMDEQCAGAGATVVPIRPGAKAAPMHCELVDGLPQFALGLDLNGGRGAQAAIDGLGRRKAFMDAVRSEYRALGVGSRRIARVGSVQDGAGGSATIEQRNSHQHEKPARGRKAADEESTPGLSGSSRRSAPLSSDTDYMRRLEDQYREANPDLVIN